MGKYKFIYCNRCEEFYLSWSTDYTSPPTKACPNWKCHTKDIVEFKADSFSEMAQIERSYKIEKINKKKTG
jgi:hypothetical protein